MDHPSIILKGVISRISRSFHFSRVHYPLSLQKGNENHFHFLFVVRCADNPFGIQRQRTKPIANEAFFILSFLSS
jgi:hypothetical protein